MCARFLKSEQPGPSVRRACRGLIGRPADFANILVPLSQSQDVSMEQKRAMIDKFLEVRRTSVFPSNAPSSPSCGL